MYDEFKGAESTVRGYKSKHLAAATIKLVVLEVTKNVKSTLRDCLIMLNWFANLLLTWDLLTLLRCFMNAQPLC